MKCTKAAVIAVCRPAPTVTITAGWLPKWRALAPVPGRMRLPETPPSWRPWGQGHEALTVTPAIGWMSIDGCRSM